MPSTGAARIKKKTKVPCRSFKLEIYWPHSDPVASYLSEICAWRVGTKKFALDVLLNALDDAVFVQEMYLVFCGMDIDVNVVRRDL